MTEVGGQTLVIETGLLARQAAGAVTVTLGNNVVFSAVTNTDSPREGIDYFPLQVEYREKFYACGRMPGGFFKREAKPSEKEILTARLTDRPVRPLFPDGYHNDVQVNNTLLAADGVHEPEVGKVYEGQVTGIKEFGAFVEILPGVEGLCHISEFSDKYLKTMDGVCQVGDMLKVKCLAVEKSRIKLSRKAVLLEEKGE